MDLLAFERKLDQTIARKRMEIQEAIKKPLTVRGRPGGQAAERGGGRRWVLPAILSLSPSVPPSLFSYSTAKAEAEDLHLQHFHPGQRRRRGW